jgi:hypothetical protein
MNPHPDRLERELDELFAAYRRAVPDPEPSANFMPVLWQKIESRQNAFVLFQRWVRGVVSLAAAASVLMLMLQVLPEISQHAAPYTYVEVLAEDQAGDQLLYQDVALADPRAEYPQPEYTSPR